MRSYVDVGTVAGIKGINGRLVVRRASGLPFFLSEGTVLFAVPPKIDIERRLVVDAAEEYGSKFDVSLKDMHDPGIANEYIGCHLLVDSSEVPEDVAFQIEVEEFGGWQLEDINSGITASVENVSVIAGTKYLEVVVRDSESSCLVPFVNELTHFVDSESKKIWMKLPNGIFDI